MKARIHSILFSAIVATASLSSCEPDKCKSIVCAHNGTCTEGTCVCPSGYEGPQCETINRERFKGVWTTFEDGTITLPAQYSVAVDDGKATNEVVIRNFYNRLTTNVTGYVKADTLRVPLQTVNVGGIDYTVQGIGALMDDKYVGDHGKIVFNFSVTYNAGNGQVTDDFGLTEGASSVWIH